MARDRIIYMIAKGIEAVVGIVTMSCMTHFFTASQMGQYTVVNIAITFFGMVAIQWLAQAVLRYVNKYDTTERKEEFYGTVLSTWLRINLMSVAILAIAGVALGIIGAKGIAIANTKIPAMEVIFWGCMWFFTYNTTLIITSMLAALREATLNLYISVISVVGRLFFIVVLTRILGNIVEIIFISYFLVDAIICLIGFKKLHFLKYILMRKMSKDILKELGEYGMPLMGNMVTNSILNKSDAYIITGYVGSAATGIYQTNYSIVATAFTMLSSSIMRGSYPTILKVWSEGRKEEAISLISDSVRTYLLLAVPAVVGVTSVSDVLAASLFDKEYFSGNDIMFWVALGMMILGLTEYSIKPWELNAKTQNILRCSLIGGLANLGLNLIFVPIWGYKVAAVTTFIGFAVYFIAVKIGTRKYQSWKLRKRTYVNLLLSVAVMYIVIVFIKQYLPYNIFTLAFLVMLGVVVYGVTLLVTGEVKEEAKAILRRLKK